MAKFTALALQEVAENENVQFTDDSMCGGMGVIHRNGAGQVTLRGSSTQCRARYRVSFSGNIQIPAGGTVEAISIALAVSGEAIESNEAIVTPAAVENFWHVTLIDHIDVPCNCCVSVSVKNTSGQPIEVQNASLIIERIA